MNISLIILTYNHARYIKSCLESIKYQELNFNKNREHKIQIVVSDDCSKDNTLDVITRWQRDNWDFFEDIIVLNNRNNMGTCKNLLRAINYATYDYIKILGGDDLLIDDSIFDILKYLDEYDFVFGIPYFYEPEGENGFSVRKRLYEKLHCNNINAEKKYFYNLIRGWNVLYAPAVFIRKELLFNSQVIEAIGKYKYIDDTSMWLAMSEIKNIKHHYVPQYVVVYRRTQKSTYKQRSTELMSEMIRVCSYAEKTATNIFDKMVMRSNLFCLRHGISLSIGGIIYNMNWLLNRYLTKYDFFERYHDIYIYIQRLEHKR